MSGTDTIGRGTRPVARRYTAADLHVFSPAEMERFATLLEDGTDSDGVLPGGIAWEVLYRLEPDLYDRWASAERIHPSVAAWLPRDAGRVVEVAPGTGRLTMDLLGRCRELVAVEPAGPLRALLTERIKDSATQAEVRPGFFDALPVADDWADLVVSCSALTPEPGHGGHKGLKEMERVARPGGRVVLVWPNHIPWLKDQGYEHVAWPGETAMEFRSLDEALELTAIFSPNALEEIRRRGSARVPYAILGVNPPCDVAFKDLPA